MIDNSKTENNYDVFLSGELIDLVIPTKDAIYKDKWFQWFNNKKTTLYLYQGIFPNSIQDQETFLEELIKEKSRIALLIKPKNEDFVIGVASLSKINFIQRQAEFAMVIGRQLKSLKSKMFGMEAKSLLTEHAFESVGLERINSAQPIELKEWQRWQILLGYKMEGISRNAFRKGYKSYDVIISGCLLEDYLKLRDLRGGNLWPGYSNITKLIKALPKESLEEKLNQNLTKIVNNYYNNIKMK